MLTELASANAKIALDHSGDSDWTSVYVTWKGLAIKAGADSLQNVVRGLMSALHPEDLPVAGRLLGMDVAAALTLSEEHCTLYSCVVPNGVMLIWQGSSGEVIGTIEVSEPDSVRWEQSLALLNKGGC